jgi:hypothetical protein
MWKKEKSRSLSSASPVLDSSQESLVISDKRASLQFTKEKVGYSKEPKEVKLMS